MDENNYTVYAHINKINYKIYIGITMQSPLKRWSNGTCYKGNKHFDRAIKKYGWDNFQHCILADNLSKQQACQLQKFFIKTLNTTNDKYGYNINSGGQHGLHSQQTKRKISESIAKIPHKKGYKYSEQSKQHIKDHIKTKKQVICLQTNEIYESVAETARVFNTCSSNIRRSIKTHIAAKNHHFDYHLATCNDYPQGVGSSEPKEEAS